jgi:aerobic carbon-monoxide dehydrogenase large subunit
MLEKHMSVYTAKFGMGASVLRLEDNALLKGQGRFTDDLQYEGLLHGFVLRSPVASGAFTIQSVEAARNAPGVHLVLTAKDIAHLKDLPPQARIPGSDGKMPEARGIPILCRDRVRYVGDAVAFIVADSRAQAQDASELIEIDFDMDDAVVGPDAVTSEDAPLVWPELGSNTSVTYRMGDIGNTDAAFKTAAKVSRIEFTNNRLVCNYMEPRVAVGEWNESEDRFVLTTGTQGVHSFQKIIAKDVFGIEPEKLRVLTFDVGGAFGPKNFVYREHPLVLEAAKRLGRPVKWASDRTEHFLTDAQGRDNLSIAEMAMDKDGRFLGLRVKTYANLGAYASQYGPFIPYVGATMLTGVYDLPAVDAEVICHFSNTCPVDAYRGAGRPEAALLLEKLVDKCARDMGLGVDEIRRRNFVRPSQFPYDTVLGRNYDVGNFDGHLEAALEKSRWSDFETRLSASKSDGKIRGIGLATYIECCAFAGSEPVHLQLEKDGTVTLDIGTQAGGQGHQTAYTQFVADKLNLPPEKIRVIQGDTDRLKTGGGTGGSRSIPLGGVSAARAGEDLAKKLRKIAADELEAAEADIEFDDGIARIAGTDRAMSFVDIAAKAKAPEDLKGLGNYASEECTYPNGSHICEVEIDPETGHCDVVSYTVVDDFGVVVNPMLLGGQVHGGIVQGIGQALHEGVVYSADGQLLTASFMDYGMPRADDLPMFDLNQNNVPSTLNPLGIKGAGEAGTIGATPAALNAVTDALYRAYGITHIEMPATPQRIWQAIQDAA